MSTINDMVEEVVEDELKDVQEPNAKQCTDPDWAEYVLDQLADHELINGAPTTDGLRRVAEKIFGQILVSDTDVIEVPKEALKGKATVKHTMVFDRIDGRGQLRVSACVDALGSSLPAPFNKHIVATACTRAEGKALRRALKIRVTTAEELVATDDPDEDNSGEPINDQQVLAINQMCKRNNLNVVGVVKDTAKSAKTIKDVKNVEGRFILTKLSEYQRSKSTLDKSLVGYNEQWQEEFGGK